MTINILVIDDEADIRDVLGDILEDEGYSVLKAAHSEQAFALIDKEEINLIVLDIWLENSDMDGIEILKTLKAKSSDNQDIPVLMISGHGNVEMAVSAMKVGAYDFVEKPFKIDHMLLTVERALEQGQLKQENTKLRDSVIGDSASAYATQSPSFQAVIKNAEEQAKTSARVMISGEIGTGKSKFARYVHGESTRHAHSLYEFVGNEMAEEQIEALFADEAYKNTTVLIKRLETLSPSAQSCLLTHVSAQQPSDSPRFICTTLKKIQDEISKGAFSSALYDRMAVAHFEMPTLPERYEDIPDLVGQFTANMCADMNSPLVSFGAEALIYLQDYPWKGNIRQLKSTVDWIALNHILNENVAVPISVKEVKAILDGSTGEDFQVTHNDNVVEAGLNNTVEPVVGDHYLDQSLREAREEFERYYLSTLMKRFRGNISQMAQHVDMERTALHRKLKTMGIRYDELIQNQKTERAAG